MIKTGIIQRFSPIIAILLFSFFPLSLSAQEYFKGIIEYDISYSGSHIDLAEREQLPETVRIIARKDNVRHEMLAGELKQVKITDAEQKKVTTLLEIDNKKYAIVSDWEKIQQQLTEMPEVELVFTDERIDILGYSCKKIIAVTYNEYGEKISSEIYFTEEINGHPFNFDMPYSQVPGLMLKYEIRAGDLVMQYKVSKIEEKAFIRGKNFKVPSEYQPTTFEALSKILSAEY